MKKGRQGDAFKWIGTLLAIVVLVYTYQFFFTPGGADVDGTITFILIDEDGKEVVNETLDYTVLREDGQKNNLLLLLTDHYDVVCGEPDTSCLNPLDHGHFILTIEGIETNFTSDYFAIYLNEAYSSFALDRLDFTDGDVLVIRKEKVN